VTMRSDVELTGVPGLDDILGGGLPGRGIVVVMGAPGTGKTLLVQQLAFAAARAGRKALYFSSLSEPHERLVEHLRPFSFFDEGILGQDIQFLSLGSAAEQGADAAAAAVMQTTRRADAGLVVIDGLRRLTIALSDTAQGRGFLYRLGAQIGLLGGLLIVVMEARPPAEELFPDLAVTDVLLGLFFERSGAGHRRYLEVYKRRGAAHVPGLHAITIGADGIACHPKFELTVSADDVGVAPSDRARLGPPALDDALGGGLTRATTTLLLGGPGTGKTLLGLHFLAEGLAQGEPGLLLGFREPSARLLATMSQLGESPIDVGAAVGQGTLCVLVQPPVTPDPDVLAHQVRTLIRQAGVRRVVVDSLAELGTMIGPERARGFMAALCAMLCAQGVTTLLIDETSVGQDPHVDTDRHTYMGLYDNALAIHSRDVGGKVQRSLGVIKMRFSDYDSTPLDLTIGDRGVRAVGRSRGAVETPKEQGGPSST
jgi:circadian clock protein KaiC